MKKTLIAFAALSAIAGMAQAQSTVTIYGLLDGNIQSLKTNVAGSGAQAGTIQNLTQAKIDTAGLNGSRWGIRVSEDLGGGLAAVGNLESGFNLDTGASAQGGLLFGRRANVGLSGGFGTVVIGRNSSSYDDVSGDGAMMEQTIFDPTYPYNNNSTGAAAALLAANTPAALVTASQPFLNGRNGTFLGYAIRFNNSIKYTSPNFSGFSGSVMYALGEDKTTAVGSSNSFAANIKYANGPLVVSGGYQSEGGARTATLTPKYENTLVSASYDFGVAKLGGAYNVAKYKDVAPGVSLDSQKEYNLSVAVPFGATVVSAGYARSKGNSFGTSSGYGIQALYSLSKRTTLYAGASSTKAYDRLANAVLLASPTSSIGNTTTYGVGMRHRF